MPSQQILNRVTVPTLVTAIASSTAVLLSAPGIAQSIPQAMALEPPHVLAQTITPDASSTTEGEYSNEFFGFSMDFPTDWAIASQETREEIMDMGTEIISNNNPALGESAAAALQNTYQLLLISQDPPETPTQAFNPNLLSMAERVSTVAAIISGEDYLANHRALIGQTGLPYEAIGEIYPFDLDGQSFYRSDFQLGGVLQQSYIFTVDQGYAYGFILSGLPEQMADLEAIVNSIQFD